MFLSLRGEGARPPYAQRVDDFVIARNPDPDSALPYLLRLPLVGRWC